MVRAALTAVLCVSLILTIASVVLLIQQSGVPGWLAAVTALAAVCQGGTVLWLTRFRLEE